MLLKPDLGLFYIPQWLTSTEQSDLISAIDDHPWCHDLKRRTQHYGYKYDYTKRTIDESMKLGDLPDFLQPLAARLKDIGLFPILPDQAIVNEYVTGQSIAPHTDCVPCFDGTIVSVSLLNSCFMQFFGPNGEFFSVQLEPGSLLALTGEARWKWMHGIKSVKVDRRVSVTFRKVLIPAS